ncbi:MAG: hypothetical protein H0T89_13385 [Deltaproteobacteria bacterium]|nr:hypothetical protein [Deltaproteobacteria bacterium]
MADLVLRLRVDPATGRREVVVDYHSDSDALPIEHEDEHRRLAGKVVEGGLDGPGVEVSREEEAPAAAAPTAGDEAVREATKSRG